jgi:CTP:molybdopterin cytidylyltransferase MocA
VSAVAGLVLAAGGGSRLGRPKALVRYEGELLVERAARLLADGGCSPVLAVLGAAADEVRATAALPGVSTVDNPDWPTGMASSLRVGLRSLPDAGAVVVTLVDLPLLGPEAVRRLVEARRQGAAAAVATYAGSWGHPVLLSREVAAEVGEAARGDQGARAWLRKHPERVWTVPCDGTGDPSDVDVPEDLAALPAGEE